MKRHWSVVLIATAVTMVVVLLALLACKPEPKNVERQLVNANNDFAVQLFKELKKAESDENVFISPISITLMLSMLYNGADGSTKDDIANVLGYQEFSLEQINSANGMLLEDFRKTDAGVKLEIANLLWENKGYAFRRDFIDQNDRFYSAKLVTLPFDSITQNIINSWVSQKTGGKIKNLIPGFSPNDTLLLVSAAYFKGNWANEFDRSGREDMPFRLSNGKKKTVAMMHKTDDLSYFSNKDAAIICIPYQDERYGMWIILPHQNTRLSDYVKRMDAQLIESWLRQCKNETVEIDMPAFEIEYSADAGLKNALSKMGMRKAFEPGADFSRMSSESPYISGSNHKTTLCVNEEGTEAAAATEMLAYTGDGGSIGPKPISFKVDHPFICLIRDNQTKSILFIGAVENP